MPWMRVAIVVGGAAMVSGVAGMVVWIDDGPNYFAAAAALASAGMLTLVACVLTNVFGSSHGSQDDAFRRGRSMGYDAGFLEGRRGARPVVVPLHIVGGRHLEAARDLDPDLVTELHTPTDTTPVWRREESRARVTGSSRLVSWMEGWRSPLLAGVLGLTLLGVLAASAFAFARMPVPVQALQRSPGAQFSVPQPHVTPPPFSSPGYAGAAHAAKTAGAAHAALVAQAAAGGKSGATGRAGAAGQAAAGAAGQAAAGTVGQAAAGTAGQSAAAGTVGEAGAAGGAGMSPVAGGALARPVVATANPPGSLTSSGAGVVAPSTTYVPAVVTKPSAAPRVVATAPLTSAEQTAADAKAAADLTAANAKAAADLTAANAAAAADLTAANAAAAAAATAKAAADAAWAVAHPQT